MNRIVVDLNKVQFGKFYYRNQHGQTSELKPKFSVHGCTHNPTDYAYIPGEKVTLKEHADKLGITDVWTPECKFQFSANHSVVYKGDKAKSMWKEWSRRIFNNK